MSSFHHLRRLSLGAFACGIAVTCSVASAQEVRYAVFDMGTFGGDEAAAIGVNEVGEVVGWAKETEFLFRAALWQNGVLTDIDPKAPPGGSIGVSISNLGEVAGIRSDVGGVVWLTDGKWVNLGSLGGRWGSTPHAMNDARQIVGGSSSLPDNFTHPFLWEDGKMIDLGTFGGDKGHAYGINNLGQIVGSAWTPQPDTHPFFWENGEMTELPLLENSRIGQAFDINDAGLIVGYSRVIVNDYAVMWVDRQVIQIHDGSIANWSGAGSVNSHGVIVGSMGVGGGRTSAFIYENDQMIDLNTLLPPRRLRDIERANDINDAGWIVGETRGNPVRGAILVPVNTELTLAPPTPGTAEAVNTLTVTGADPGARIHFVYSTTGGGTIIPGCDLQTGAALFMNNPKIIGSAIADQNGEASITRFVPRGARHLGEVLIQAVDQQGCKVSQLVVEVFE